MALIKCPECGRQVSDKAAACPDCGYPINSSIQSHAESTKPKYDNENFDSSKFRPVSGSHSLADDDTGSTSKYGSEMRTCPACGKPVAYSAKFCPHCGKKEPFGLQKYLIGLLVIFIIVMLMSAMGRR